MVLTLWRDARQFVDLTYRNIIKHLIVQMQAEDINFWNLILRKKINLLYNKLTFVTENTVKIKHHFVKFMWISNISDIQIH